MKILFVCLGNICRSPLAEGVFKHKIKEKGLEKRFEADSCGTADYNIGDPPHPQTIKNARENGIDFQHVARQLAPADLETYDMILAMDESTEAAIVSLDSESLLFDKIHLMREFDTIGTGEDVPDPFGGTERDFQKVFEMIDRSVEGLISYLVREQGNN